MLKCSELKGASESGPTPAAGDVTAGVSTSGMLPLPIRLASDGLASTRWHTKLLLLVIAQVVAQRVIEGTLSGRHGRSRKGGDAPGSSWHPHNRLHPGR